MEAELRALGQSSGLKMLKRAMAEMTKGELGLRMQVWKAGKQAAKEAAAEAAMAAALKNSSNSAGVKMLKQAMARLAKGELGYLVMLWKAGQKAAAVQVALDVQNGLKQGAGLKMLQRAFAAFTKGELGVCLMEWKSNRQE